MLVIGLTGGVGSGKTTVAEAFAKRGVPVIDADLIARELVTPGMPALEDIVRQFGADLLLPDGSLNRRVLRTRVFGDEAARKRLEAVLHPGVRAEMFKRLQAIKAPYAILAIPLLIEAAMTDLVDRILVVDCEPEQQIARVVQRDACDPAQVQAMIAAQISRQARLAAAQDVIDNRGDARALDAAVAALHQRYLQLAGA